MISKIQLRENAWEALRSARTLAAGRHWVGATDRAGLAVELILKARVCADENRAGFPEDIKEAKAMGCIDLISHQLEFLLNRTKAVIPVKSNVNNEWAACVHWSPSTKYQPMGSATEKSADVMIRSADAILRAIEAEPGLEAVIVAATDNPVVKLISIEREFSIRYGDFALFAACHRQDDFEKVVDVVVCAPWIDAYTREGANEISDSIKKLLTPEQLVCISGVIPLDESNPFVKGLSFMKAKHQAVSMGTLNLNGVNLGSYTLITSLRKEDRN